MYTVEHFVRFLSPTAASKKEILYHLKLRLIDSAVNGIRSGTCKIQNTKLRIDIESILSE